MAKIEKTSETVASIAARGLKDPGSLTKAEIKALSATALTQAPDVKKAAPKTPAAKTLAKPTARAATIAPAKAAKPAMKAPAKTAAKPMAKVAGKKK